MATSESAFKQAMAARLRTKEGCYCRRFEDQYAVGIPDTIIIPVGGPTFFAEVKLVRTGEAWGPTPRQHEELRRIGNTEHAIPMMICWRLSDDTVHFDFPAPKLKLPGIISFPRLSSPWVPHFLAYARQYRRRVVPLTDVSARGTVGDGEAHVD